MFEFGGFAVRIPDDDVGVTAQGDRALPVLQSRQFRGRGQHPFPYLIEGRTPAEYSQTKLQGSDAAPGAPEIAALHFGRTGGVIGGYQVDDALFQRCPKALSILPLADRRRTFELRRAVGDVFGRERQVVRAGFDGAATRRRGPP